MAPDDPHPDDEPEARDDPDPEAVDDPESGGEAPVESDALAKLRELRARVRGQFDSLHSEIESLRQPRADDDSEPGEPVAEEAEPVPEERGTEPAPEDEAAGAVAEEAEPPPEDEAAGAVAEEIQWSSSAEGGVEPEKPLDEALDLAATGAGVDPGIFYAPRGDAGVDEVHPDDVGAGTAGAGGSTVFDIEAEGWEAAARIDDAATVEPDAAPGVPADDSPRSRVDAEAATAREPGDHGLPDWVFGADEQPPATHPPSGAQPAGVPWPEAAPLGDAEHIFSPPGATVRRVVIAVLVFALIVALVILVIQLFDDGDSGGPTDGAAPAAVVHAAPPLPA